MPLCEAIPPGIEPPTTEKVLPPQYIAGLVDGEGCFALNFRRDKRHERRGRPEYFYWKVAFYIVLRKDDQPLLERVRDTLGCGSITVSGQQARYGIQDMVLLRERIVPFSLEYRLYGKKWQDFVLWAEALDILHRTRQTPMRKGQQGFARAKWKTGEQERLLQIRNEMKAYKSKGAAWKWAKLLEEEP